MSDDDELERLLRPILEEDPADDEPLPDGVDMPDPATWTPEQLLRLRRIATGEADRGN